MNAIDIVPRVPMLRDTWLPNWLAPWGMLERLLRRHNIAYGHAGEARLCEMIIQVGNAQLCTCSFLPVQYLQSSCSKYDSHRLAVLCTSKTRPHGVKC